MLNHKEALGRLVKGITARNPVTVRETNFGYIIRSTRSAEPRPLRHRAGQFAMTAFWAAGLGIWLVPLAGPALAIKAIVSVLCLAAGYLAFMLLGDRGGGAELHVDTCRRELRSAVVTPQGKSWIRTSARFGEVTDVFMRRPRADEPVRVLCLRIGGEEEPMPVAVGDEATLLAVHARLMRDLRPLEERLASRFNVVNVTPLREVRTRIFPPLGPDEVAG